MRWQRGEDLARRRENYDVVGATEPGSGAWGPGRHPGYRGFERTVRLGRGEAYWEAASRAVLVWGIKTRSGFTVDPPDRVGVGGRHWLIARFGPLRVREPVRVVAVVDRPDRRGFAYGTLEGHPVSGEEAFVVHRGDDATVWLTLRSLTRAPRGGWRLLFPAALVAQRVYRRRYARALREPLTGGR